MTLAVLLQQQQSTASPLQRLEAAAVATALPLATELNKEINMRLRKRHSSWHDEYTHEMNSQEIEWANPCGGVWNATGLEQYSHRPPVKKILRILQNNIGKEQKTLKIDTPVINISDIRSWSLHRETYKFLPVLKLNSNVALRRWHRQVQLYVASFTYLRRAQMRWDHHKLQHQSEISKELRKLKQSALRILCEIETAINNTSTQLPHADAQGRRAPRLSILTRNTVEKKLQFQTNVKQLYRTQHSNTAAVLEVDLKFAKFRYFSFLRSMVKIMRTHIRRPGQVALDSRSVSSGSVSAAASKQLDSLMHNESLDASRASNSLEMAVNRTKNIRHNKNSSSNVSTNNSRKSSRKPKTQRQQNRTIEV